MESKKRKLREINFIEPMLGKGKLDIVFIYFPTLFQNILCNVDPQGSIIIVLLACLLVTTCLLRIVVFSHMPNKVF